MRQAWPLVVRLPVASPRVICECASSPGFAGDAGCCSTVNQPKDATGQFNNVWRHEFKVTVNPCDGTFWGIAPTYDNGASSPTWTETVTGKFGNGTVSFDTVPVGGGATFKVTDAPYNTSVIAESHLDAEHH